MVETYENLLVQLTAMRAKGEIDAEEFKLAKAHLREHYTPGPPKAQGASAHTPEELAYYRRIGYAVIIGLFVLFVGGNMLRAALGWNAENPAEARESRISSCFSAWDGSNRELVASVKSKLRDPSSFEHVDTRFIDRGSHLDLVMEYRARNGFGGMNVEYAEGTCRL